MGVADWNWAFFNSPFGALLYIAVLLFALSSIALFSAEALRGRRMPVSLRPYSSKRLVVALIAALAANWIYRLAMGFK
jgi:hypothetical protein